MHQLLELHERWLSRWQAAREAGRDDPRLEEIRWMLEELRVSLFAQELKTAYPVCQTHRKTLAGIGTIVVHQSDNHG